MGPLKLSIMAVEKPLGECGVREGFEEVRTLLFKAIETIINSILHPGSSHLYIIVCMSTIIESQTVLSSCTNQLQQTPPNLGLAHSFPPFSATPLWTPSRMAHPCFLLTPYTWIINPLCHPFNLCTRSSGGVTQPKPS